MAPRIPPLPREEWTDEARDIFAFWQGPEAWENGSSSTLTMTLAQHPALARMFYPFGKQLLAHSTLPARQRELLTLRIAWLYRCEYEWGHHVQWARQAGLGDAEIEALKADIDEALWSDPDLAVLQAITELSEQNQMSDGVWNRLALHFDKRQLMELIITIGHYVMLSWAIAAWGTELEPGQGPPNFALY